MLMVFTITNCQTPPTREIASEKSGKTYAFVGRNSIDKSTCKIKYVVHEGRLAALRIDGRLWSNRLRMPMVRESFELGFGSTCLGKPYKFPIQQSGANLEFIIPSTCEDFKSDADYHKYYEQDRDMDMSYAYSTHLVGSLENPTAFVHAEDVTRRDHLGSSITCKDLRPGN